jgi:hypothetical protein
MIIKLSAEDVGDESKRNKMLTADVIRSIRKTTYV